MSGRVVAAGALLAAAGLRGADGASLVVPPRVEARAALERLRRLSPGPVEVHFSPFTGSASSLDGRFPLPGVAAPEVECLEFLGRERALFGGGGTVELRLLSRQAGLGSAHLRFEPRVLGVPVGGGEVTFHLDLSAAPGAPPVVTHLSSRLYSEAALLLRQLPAEDWRPLLSAEEAARAGAAAVGARRIVPEETRVRLEALPLPPPGRLAYRVRLRTFEPRGLFVVRVDARSGEVLGAVDLIRYAPGRDGKGRVFLVSPIVALRDQALTDMDDSAAAVPAEAYSEVVLRELDGSGILRGPYVSTEPTPRAVRRVRLEFAFLRDHDGFEEVMVYYHIDSLQRFIQGLGFAGIYNRQIQVYANSEPPGVPYTDPQAYYEPSEDLPGTGVLAFGSGGADFAEDPEVIGHEYAHAVQDNQAPAFWDPFESPESPAVGEGWADWFSAVYLTASSGGFGDLCHGEWAAAGLAGLPGEEPLECFRRLDSPKRYPEDVYGEPHADGEIWSSSLWRVFEALGREEALRLVLQSNFYLGAGSGFEEAARAVVRADRQLFGGAHQVLLERVFTERGIFTPPLELTWFYLARLVPRARIPAEGGVLTSKIEIARPGTVLPTAGRGLEVYVNVTSSLLGGVGVELRSPSGSVVALNAPWHRHLPNRPLIYGRTIEPLEDAGKLAGEPVSGVWTLRLLNEGFDDGFLIEWGLRFPGFVRGDANDDGELALSDAIVLLQHLFLRGKLACQKAGDFNDDGSLSVTDAVGLLRYLLHGGAAPPDPFPQSGEDLTADGLSCGGA